MNALTSSFTLYGLSLGCMMCGAMLTDTLDSLRYHRFRGFYADHPTQVWLATLINLIGLCLMFLF